MKKLVTAIIAIVACGTLDAQNDDTAYPHVVPMTPNAAQLAKYADSPVSYYTGTPEISIPLYEINVDGVRLPISVDYHASGIRVDQEATWVGLGWSLEVGGRISRTVKSADDFNMGRDRNFPFVRQGYPDAPDLNANFDNHYELKLYEGDCETYNGSLEYDLIYDPEPDIFFYSLPGMSGKFIIDKARGPVLFDKSHNLKIEVIKSGPITFKITDKEGTEYVYSRAEITRNYTTNGWLNKNLHSENTVYDDNHNSYSDWIQIRMPDCSQDFEASRQNPYPMMTSWCLTKIITKHGREIYFTYASEIQHLPTQESCERYHSIGGAWLYYYKSKVVNNALRLSSIEGDFGRIEFHCTDRFDMKPTSQSSKKLESISIFNRTNQLIKYYKFSYGYFNDNYSGNFQYEHVFKRLKLENVTEYALNHSVALVPLNNGYSFDYYEGDLPPKNSKNVDYWGFQNGRSYGDKYYVGLKINSNLTFEGVKKDSNFDKAIIGTLRRITYPTGGTAEYEFESNTISSGYFEGHTYEWMPPLGSSNYLMLDVFNYYVSVDHELYDYLPTQHVETFFIGERTNVKINCQLENTMQSVDNSYHYESLSNPLGQLRRISPATNINYTYVCPLVFDASPTSPDGIGSEVGLTERQFTLEPGTYQFEAFQPPRDVLASWRLHFDRPLAAEPGPTPTPVPGPYMGGGIRIREIRSDAKVRKFKYATGTMIKEPVLYYMGRRNGIPNHAGSCLVQVSESKTPLTSFNRGNFVGYDWVEEAVGNESIGISKTRYTFHNDAETEMFNDGFPDSPYYLNYTNGLIASIERFQTEAHSAPKPVEKEEFIYESNYSNVIKAFRDRGQKRYDSDLLAYYYQVEWPLRTQHVQTLITDAGEYIVKKTNYSYNSRDLLESTSYDLDDYQIVERLRYPFDFGDLTSAGMTSKNIVGVPVESITLRDNRVIQATKTQYENVSGLYLAKAVFKANLGDEYISETDYHAYYQSDLYFNDYDSKGNLLDVSRPNGLHTFYVWGYNKEYPIAKIENFNSLVDMTPAIQNLIANAEAASENDNDHCTDDSQCEEKNLRAALHELRTAVPEAFVTSYTYDPLIGVTSMTDANNKTIFYEYDFFGRLKLVKDEIGNVLKMFEYHYKQD